MPTITIGCDPEAFVREVATGKFVSAHDLLPGTKEKPFPVKGGAIQVDGVAAEFNIMPAVSSAHFEQYIGQVMGALRDRLGPKYELVIEPFARFDKDYFDKLPPIATELGCNPDFNAWTNSVNDRPEATGDMYGVRTASGHIHIGWTEGMDPNDPSHVADCNLVAQNLDYFLGCTSIMWDRDNTRRALYGKAGAVRYKPYGVEYRVLSNKWLSDPRLIHYVWNSAYTAVNSLFRNEKPIETILGNQAVDIINNSTQWWVNKNTKVFKTLSGRIMFPQEKYWENDKAPISEKKASHSY